MLCALCLLLPDNTHCPRCAERAAKGAEFREALAAELSQAGLGRIELREDPLVPPLPQDHDGVR